jgi:transcriptional regulator with XRE-family HTH domain
MEFWKNHFGRRLKAARQKKGLSQAKLGEALGDDLKVEPSSVSRWETGHDSPDERRLSKLFEILEVNENYFLELKT